MSWTMKVIVSQGRNKEIKTSITPSKAKTRKVGLGLSGRGDAGGLAGAIWTDSAGFRVLPQFGQKAKLRQSYQEILV